MLYTVGHSIRSESDFLALMKRYAVDLLVDIRTIPRSRRNPQFNSGVLEASLRDRGIGYVHLPELGGLRKPSSGSRNTGWKNPGFRGYADYMSTGQFEQGVERLINLASERNVALMCAEAYYGNCHRMLLADGLVVRNKEVLHILDENQVSAHVLTTFATVSGTKITYPAGQSRLEF